MAIQKIDHIGIAVESLEVQIPFYRDVLQFEFRGTEVVEEQQVRVAIFRVGGVRIELLEPTNPESPVARFLKKNGAGLHHIAYQSDNIGEDIQSFLAQNIKMIDEEPKSGAHNSRIAFVHPKSSGRVLTELCQISSEK